MSSSGTRQGQEVAGAGNESSPKAKMSSSGTLRSELGNSQFYAKYGILAINDSTESVVKPSPPVHAVNTRLSQLHDGTIKFPKLQDCAHFHYDFVELMDIHVSLSENQENVCRTPDACASTSDVYLYVLVQSGDKEWTLRRTQRDFCTFDRQLHRCIFDRRFSLLPDLAASNNHTDIMELKKSFSLYMRRFSAIAGNMMNCGPVLSWLEMDNRGNRLMVADDSDINTPAVAAAHVVRRYTSQAIDELSFEVGDMVSIIDMPPLDETVWWRGKRSFEVGFFPRDCVEVIGESIPQAVSSKIPATPVKPVLRKKGKLISFLRAFFTSRPTRTTLKRTGIVKERVFGCDLGEHLLNSGHQVPLVLKSCTEMIELEGIVDGIYRLSGVASNIQRLRNEFDEDRVPDLAEVVYQQDIHSVSSLLKMYFRDLPNPLLTYQLYDSFAAAVQESENRLVRVHDVIQQLPPPHYRTTEFLMKHLSRISKHAVQTGMHCKNLAIVWAPNLLRSKQLEQGCSSAVLEGVGVQAIVTEVLISYADILFSDRLQNVTGSRNVAEPVRARPKSLAISTPTRLLSLEEARERALYGCGGQGPDSPPAQTYIDVGGGAGALPAQYHTVIELPPNKKKRKKSPTASGWRSIFSRSKTSSSDWKSSHRHCHSLDSGPTSAGVDMPRMSLSGDDMKGARLRPVRSVDSLFSSNAPPKGGSMGRHLRDLHHKDHHLKQKTAGSFSARSRSCDTTCSESDMDCHELTTTDYSDVFPDSCRRKPPPPPPPHRPHSEESARDHHHWSQLEDSHCHLASAEPSLTDANSLGNSCEALSSNADLSADIFECLERRQQYANNSVHTHESDTPVTPIDTAVTPYDTAVMPHDTATIPEHTSRDHWSLQLVEKEEIVHPQWPIESSRHVDQNEPIREHHMPSVEQNEASNWHLIDSNEDYRWTYCSEPLGEIAEAQWSSIPEDHSTRRMSAGDTAIHEAVMLADNPATHASESSSDFPSNDKRSNTDHILNEFLYSGSANIELSENEVRYVDPQFDDDNEDEIRYSVQSDSKSFAHSHSEYDNLPNMRPVTHSFSEYDNLPSCQPVVHSHSEYDNLPNYQSMNVEHGQTDVILSHDEPVMHSPPEYVNLPLCQPARGYSEENIVSPSREPVTQSCDEHRNLSRSRRMPYSYSEGDMTCSELIERNPAVMETARSYFDLVRSDNTSSQTSLHHKKTSSSPHTSRVTRHIEPSDAMVHRDSALSTVTTQRVSATRVASVDRQMAVTPPLPLQSQGHSNEALNTYGSEKNVSAALQHDTDSNDDGDGSEEEEDDTLVNQSNFALFERPEQKPDSCQQTETFHLVGESEKTEQRLDSSALSNKSQQLDHIQTVQPHWHSELQTDVPTTIAESTSLTQCAAQIRYRPHTAIHTSVDTTQTSADRPTENTMDTFVYTTENDTEKDCISEEADTEISTWVESTTHIEEEKIQKEEQQICGDMNENVMQSECETPLDRGLQTISETTVLHSTAPDIAMSCHEHVLADSTVDTPKQSLQTTPGVKRKKSVRELTSRFETLGHRPAKETDDTVKANVDIHTVKTAVNTPTTQSATASIANVPTRTTPVHTQEKHAMNAANKKGAFQMTAAVRKEQPCSAVSSIADRRRQFVESSPEVTAQTPLGKRSASFSFSPTKVVHCREGNKQDEPTADTRDERHRCSSLEPEKQVRCFDNPTSEKPPPVFRPAKPPRRSVNRENEDGDVGSQRTLAVYPSEPSSERKPLHAHNQTSSEVGQMARQFGQKTVVVEEITPRVTTAAATPTTAPDSIETLSSAPRRLSERLQMFEARSCNEDSRSATSSWDRKSEDVTVSVRGLSERFEQSGRIASDVLVREGSSRRRHDNKHADKLTSDGLGTTTALQVI